MVRLAGEGAKVGVVVPAAGRGRRMGGVEKAFLELAGRPMLEYALKPFLYLSEVRVVVVALAREVAAEPPGWLPALDSRIRLVAGGEERLDSVHAGMEELDSEVDVVLVHDAARPLVTVDVIRRCLSAVEPGVGAVAGWPAVDTLKEVDEGGRVLDTPDRSRFWRAQTPQAFPGGELRAAYRSASEAGLEATDDAAVFAWAGGTVRMVEGSPWNLKVTHPEDLRVAAALLQPASGRSVPS